MQSDSIKLLHRWDAPRATRASQGGESTGRVHVRNNAFSLDKSWHNWQSRIGHSGSHDRLRANDETLKGLRL
jgi:hypothetical protein